MEIKICLQCGKEFLAKKENQKYCSNQCVGQSQKKQIEVQCKYCGKIINTHKTDPHKYCSVECSGLASRNQITKICPQCQKEFSIPFHDAKTRKYCSYTCFAHKELNWKSSNHNKWARDWQRRKYLQKNPQSPKRKSTPGKFSIQCIICNKTITVYHSRIKTKKTCSSECLKKLQSIHSSKRKDKTCELECEYCGKLFRICKSRVQNGRRFCSKNCYLASTSPTTPEKLVSEYLQTNNIAFKEQVKIGRYHVDFLVSDNILIEVYGDYWHAHPGKYDRRSLLPQQKKVYERDKRRKEFLTQKGYKFFSVWERDVKKNTRLALEDAILEYKQLKLF